MTEPSYCDGCGAPIGRTLVQFCERCHDDTPDGRAERRAARARRQFEVEWDAGVDKLRDLLEKSMIPLSMLEGRKAHHRFPGPQPSESAGVPFP